MIKKKFFAVFDSKVGKYAQPFMMQTSGEAIRGFTDVANDPQSQICKYPEDFTLFELGEYDEDTGKFTNLETPHSLGVAVQVKKQGAN